MQNKTIYIIILVSVATGSYYLFSSQTLKTEVDEVVIIQNPIEQNIENITKKDINLSVPEGWYVNKTDTDGAILITKHETLPNIGATETYAYGDLIIISIVTDTTGAPLKWVDTPEKYVDENYPDSKNNPLLHLNWGSFNQYQTLDVVEDDSLGGDYALTRYVFTNEQIVSFHLYGNRAENISVLDEVIKSYFENN